MKTYQVTLSDDTAALVERMMEDGPWETIDELFQNSIGTLQEDVIAEEEMNLDYDEVRRKLKEAEDDVAAGRVYDGEEVFKELMARVKNKPALSGQ